MFLAILTIAMTTTNISHFVDPVPLETAVEHAQMKVRTRGDLPYASVEMQLGLIDGLKQFDLGRWLLAQRGGLNGFWNYYVVSYPEKQYPTTHPLERYLLEKCPVALATQQRFSIFKKEAQKRIKEGTSFAAIPCGLMGDLLELNYSQVENFHITGIDLDPEAISGAKEFAQKEGLLKHCGFAQKDAWNLGIANAFDLITSNGLTIYEPDDDKVAAFYEQCYQALKPEGILLASFLTPPLLEGKLNVFPTEDLLLQKILFMDIFESRWQCFRTTDKTLSLLKQAGFDEIEIIYDNAHLFPTAIAKKT